MHFRPRHVRRHLEIARLLWRHRTALGLPAEARLPGLEEETAAERADGLRPEALAADLEALGPTFVKLGQLLSTRPDLVPEGHARALARLQDRVQPVPFPEVQRAVEDSLGVRLGHAFARFEEVPLASASLGQVHRAALRDGRPVAVKVQRPGVARRIEEDFECLEDLAALLERRTELGRRWRLSGILEEARTSLTAELDYEEEARSLERLAAELRDYRRIVVPLPVHDYTRDRVLTMDYVRGRKVTQLGPLGRLELDGEGLVDDLLAAYLEQILVHGFFHADPHPGNVFVTDGGDLALLDLGMVARIPPETQELLLKLVLALGEGRAEETAEHALQLSEKLPEAREPELRRAVAQLLGRGEPRTGTLVLELAAALTRAGFGIRRELHLLGKTLVQLDEICHTLAPGFDVNAAIRRRSVALVASRLRRDLRSGHVLSGFLEAKELMERLPARANRILDALAEDRLTLRVRAIDELRWIEGMQKIANRITTGLVLAALIVGGALLMSVSPPLAVLCLVVAAVLGGSLVLEVVGRDVRRRP
jgi:ubiquinone biosynthesis protein